MLKKATKSDRQALKNNFEMIYELDTHKWLYPKGHSPYYELPGRGKEDSDLIYVSILNDTIIGYFYAHIKNRIARDIVTINFYDKPNTTFSVDMYKFIKLLISKVNKATFYSLESSDGHKLDSRIIEKFNGRILPKQSETITLKDGTQQTFIKFEVKKRDIKCRL